MSKPTLGRGLSDLLGTRPNTVPATNTPSRVDGGLRILIDGAAREEEPAAPTQEAEAPKPAVARSTTPQSPVPKPAGAVAAHLLAVVALAGADAALLGWAICFALTHEHALGLLPAALCVLSVLTAALCGCAAILLRQGQD